MLTMMELMAMKQYLFATAITVSSNGFQVQETRGDIFLFHIQLIGRKYLFLPLSTTCILSVI